MAIAKKARQKVLALDYGTKRIGVATNFGFLAEPLTVILNETDEQHPLLSPAALERLRQLVKEQHTQRLVVGVSEQAMAATSRRFAQQLKESLLLPVDLVDETLTSQAALQKMREAKLKKRKLQGPMDHYAAALILEEWLNV